MARDIIIPEDIQKILLQRLKHSSVKRYNGWLLNFILPDGVYDIDKIASFHERIDDDMKKRKDFTGILGTAVALLYAHGRGGETDVYKKLRREARGNQEVIETASKQELKNKMTMDDIIGLLKEKWVEYDRNPIFTNALPYLFLQFIVDLAPLRADDYIHISFKNSPDTHFLDTKKGVLHINFGKQKDAKRDIQIPDELLSLIKLMKKYYGMEWLFPKVRDPTQQMTQEGMKKWMQRIFKKSVSSTTLRQVFVSHWKDIDMPKEERIRRAKMMGHTYNIAERHYTKYSTKVHGEMDEPKDEPKEEDTLVRDVEMDALMDENAEFKRMLEKQQEQMKKQQEQIEKLMSVVQHLISQ